MKLDLSGEIASSGFRLCASSDSLVHYFSKSPLWIVAAASLLVTPSAAYSQVPLSAPTQRRASLTLDEAIQAAVTNPSVMAARERVAAARGSLRTARTWSNPTLSYQVENAPLPGSNASGLEREESMFAMLPLEPLYQLGPRVRRARLEVTAANYELSEARRVTVVAASAAFFRAAAAQIAVRSATEVNAWLDSLIAYTSNRVREGATAEADLLRLQVESGRADVDLAMARIDLARELAELSVFTGIEIDSVSVDPRTSSPTSAMLLSSPDSLAALALARRPDVAASFNRVQAAAAGISTERRAIVREIGAMAGVKKMEGERSLMAGLSIPFPLFDRNAGEIQRAQAEQRAAAFEYDQVRRRVGSEIRAAFGATVALESALNKTRNLVARAEESRRIAEAAYREGAIPLTQVIEAARALADARQADARAYFGWRAAFIELTSSTTIQSQERRQ
jgi:cobalt-zinc-cadmium efflux system outer membrane protein